MDLLFFSGSVPCETQNVLYSSIASNRVNLDRKHWDF